MYHFIVLLLLFTATLFSQTNKVDGIAAIVGDEIILLSELDAYTTMRLGAMGLENNATTISTYKHSFLNEIIDGKILLVHGKKDTTITVGDEEVEQATNNHIAMLLKQNNLSIDSLEVELKRQQGISLAKFKTDARKIIREQLIKQKVHQTYLSTIKINRKDVESFFEQYKDSLPKLGESVSLSKLSLSLSPSAEIRQKAYDKIQMVKRSLDNGELFEECAKKYSESPEAADGGNLGFIVKGSLNEISFEDKAFNLSTGEVSEPFETRLGFHIVKVVERRDNGAKLQQIFIKVEPSPENIVSVTRKVDSIRTSCKTASDFSNAVNLFSTDPASKSNNGKIGWVSPSDLTAELKEIIDSLSVGSISKPVKENNFISIYRLNDKVKNRSLSLENDYLVLETKAKDIVAQKKLVSLVEGWRNKIFIDIRI